MNRTLGVILTLALFFTITYFLEIGLWLLAGVVVYSIFYLLPKIGTINFSSHIDQYNQRIKDL